MWFVFKLTFDVSTPFVDWVDIMMAGPVSRWTAALFTFIHAPPWVTSLATDGVIAGVGFVLVFVPVIFAMMFFLTFLEASGYMARAAFVMDRAMHTIGLHGKSFIPMLMGFGCNVPAVYATRTLESTRRPGPDVITHPLDVVRRALAGLCLVCERFFRQAFRAGIVVALCRRHPLCRSRRHHLQENAVSR